MRLLGEGVTVVAPHVALHVGETNVDSAGRDGQRVRKVLAERSTQALGVTRLELADILHLDETTRFAGTCKGQLRCWRKAGHHVAFRLPKQPCEFAGQRGEQRLGIRLGQVFGGVNLQQRHGPILVPKPRSAQEGGNFCPKRPQSC